MPGGLEIGEPVIRRGFIAEAPRDALLGISRRVVVWVGQTRKRRHLPGNGDEPLTKMKPGNA